VPSQTTSLPTQADRHTPPTHRCMRALTPTPFAQSVRARTHTQRSPRNRGRGGRSSVQSSWRRASRRACPAPSQRETWAAASCAESSASAAPLTDSGRRQCAGSRAGTPACLRTTPRLLPRPRASAAAHRCAGQVRRPPQRARRHARCPTRRPRPSASRDTAHTHPAPLLSPGAGRRVGDCSQARARDCSRRAAHAGTLPVRVRGASVQPDTAPTGAGAGLRRAPGTRVSSIGNAPPSFPSCPLRPRAPRPLCLHSIGNTPPRGPSFPSCPL